MKLIQSDTGQSYYDYPISYAMTDSIRFANVCMFGFDSRFKVESCDIALHDSDEYLLLVANSDMAFIYLPNINDKIPTDIYEMIKQYKALMEF